MDRKSLNCVGQIPNLQLLVQSLYVGYMEESEGKLTSSGRWMLLITINT
jgi:hypothetical protein